MPTRASSATHDALHRRSRAYRLAQERFVAAGRRVINLGNGIKAYSPILPPIGSPVARRRMRLIIESMAGADLSAGASKPPIGRRVPHVATIAVTRACQCRCAHCSAARSPGDTPDDDPPMSDQELVDAIRQTVELGTTNVILTGGEPLMRPGLADLVRAVDRSKAVCSLFTNGEQLDDAAIAGLKRAGVFGIFVSLDWPTADGHDSNRGRPGLFTLAVESIRRSVSAGIPTGISTYATREKLETGALDGLMALARALGVLEVFVFDVTPSGRLAGHDDCVLEERDVEALKAFRRKYDEQVEFPRVLHQSMFSSIAYPCVAEGCPAAMVQLHIRANGDVTPCDFTGRSFGNLRRRALAEIWRDMSGSDLYAELSPRCRLALPEFRARLSTLPAPS